MQSTMDIYYHVTIFTYMATLLTRASSLKCVQCSTIVTGENEDCYYGTLPAMDCENKNETYCVKYEGVIDDVTFVIRGCDMEDKSTMCTDKVLEGELVHRCYHSCRTDGCNGASQTSCDRLSILLGLVYVFIGKW